MQRGLREFVECLAQFLAPADTANIASLSVPTASSFILVYVLEGFGETVCQRMIANLGQ